MGLKKKIDFMKLVYNFLACLYLLKNERIQILQTKLFRIQPDLEHCFEVDVEPVERGRKSVR